MDLPALTDKISNALQGGADFSNSVKFDFGDVGKIFIDGATGNVNNEDSEADATVKVSFDDFISIATGDLDPMQAFMQQKLSVAGDMSVAMKLQSLFKSLV